MNVKELRAALAGLPDEMRVYVESDTMPALPVLFAAALEIGNVEKRAGLVEDPPVDRVLFLISPFG